MEQTNEQGWEVQRRVDGLVNKYMADIALETLQQRLSMVTEEMNHLSSELARRDDSSKRTDDTSRRADLNFNLGTSEPCGGAVFAGEKFPSSSSSETAAQRKILTLLVEIKEEQQRQWAVLRDLQARMQGGQRVCEDDDVETLDVDLPLRTMEHLDQTESYLEDAMAQKKMVSHLSRMGGATVDDAVRRLMQAVLSFAVGSELNWVGRGQKRSFRNTRLQGVLFRALKRTPVGREATHHQFADVVKKWLRFAPFRQGGTGRRQTMRPHTEYICPSFLTDSQCTDHPHVSPDPKDIKLY